MSFLITKARAVAHEAHDSIGQKRKYSGEPYWTHTDAVADIVAGVTDDETMIAAAHLHDVLEDVTPENDFYSVNYIRNEFGERVLHLVVGLTNVFVKSAYPHLNRAQRHGFDRARLKATDDDTKTIKLADVIHNNSDLVSQNEGFARVYLKEKELLLPNLFGGSPILYERALNLLNVNKKILGMA